jgi:pyruvyl transferase EpsO
MQTTSQNNLVTNYSADDMWGGRKLINELQIKAHTILDHLISTNSMVALLDYPNNSNIGDSLIWLGEIAYLRSRGISPHYVCDLNNYRADRINRALKNNPVILLHGGGNFGTLWPEEQAFRIKVLREFKGTPIIQMPQSLHFENEYILAETTQAIREHGEFTLLVRDQPSYDFAQQHFDCTVTLCPDMAFFIGELKSDTQPQLDRFILSRTDHEKSTNWPDSISTLGNKSIVEIKDWLEMGWNERILGRIERHSSNLRSFVDPDNKLLCILWNYLANARLRRGKALLQSGRVIISDRLHVHILSILLNKPHALIDNVYGKLGNLHKAWTIPYQGVRLVHTLDEAFEAANILDTAQLTLAKIP